MRLFVLVGSKCYHDTKGNVYASTNLADVVVKRYRRYCDKLSVLATDDGNVLSVQEARSRFDAVDPDIADVVSIPNLHRPYKNFFNLALRKRVVDKLARVVQESDRVIIRGAGRYIPNVVIKLCRKYHKPYLVEAVDFAFEFTMLNRLTMAFAPYAEITCRREIARAPYVLYVTQSALQKRYPSQGKTIACSDVELSNAELKFTQKHLKGGGAYSLRNSSKPLAP